MFLSLICFTLCHKNTSSLRLKTNFLCLFSNESLVANVELPLTPSVEEYSSADEREDVEDISNDTEEGENRYAKYLSFNNEAYFDFSYFYHLGFFIIIFFLFSPW